MVNKKQAPVLAIILIAIIVVGGIFIMRGALPERRAARTIPEGGYVACEGCTFRMLAMTAATRGIRITCPDCGGRLIFEEGIQPPEMPSPEIMPE